MKIYVCHYVNRTDPGDLLMGYNWRKAILFTEDGHRRAKTHREIENRMVDYETGKPVGDTRNYCVDRFCNHEGCGPMTLIFEGVSR